MRKTLYNYLSSRKLRRHPEFKIRAKELLDYAGVDYSRRSQDVLEKLDSNVTGVYKAGTASADNYICVQVLNESKDTLRKTISDGALFIIADAPIDDCPCIVVPDPKAVFSKLCSWFKNLSGVRTTAVTGSIGKTTTKGMINSVYRQKFRTYSDPGNENILHSTGYIVQHIPDKTEQYIQEVSETPIGSAGYISRMISPDVVVITSVDKSHIGVFHSVENLEKEIISVASGMNPGGGYVIANVHDHRLYELLSSAHRVITISDEDKSATYYADDVCVTKDGLQFNVVSSESGQKARVMLKGIYARHDILSALYAYACGVLSGMSVDQIVKGLGAYRTSGIRQNIFSTLNRCIVYADCYNAVAESIRSAIETMDTIPVTRRLAVLGDIAEAGEMTTSSHDEIMEIVNKSKIQILYILGPELEAAYKRSTCRKDLIVKPLKSH